MEASAHGAPNNQRGTVSQRWRDAAGRSGNGAGTRWRAGHPRILGKDACRSPRWKACTDAHQAVRTWLAPRPLCQGRLGADADQPNDSLSNSQKERREAILPSGLTW